MQDNCRYKKLEFYTATNKRQCENIKNNRVNKTVRNTLDTKRHSTGGDSLVGEAVGNQ